MWVGIFNDILKREPTDEQLKTIKHDHYDETMKRKMEKPVRQGIYDFHHG